MHYTTQDVKIDSNNEEFNFDFETSTSSERESRLRLSRLSNPYATTEVATTYAMCETWLVWTEQHDADHLTSGGNKHATVIRVDNNGINSELYIIRNQDDGKLVTLWKDRIIAKLVKDGYEPIKCTFDTDKPAIKFISKDLQTPPTIEEQDDAVHQRIGLRNRKKEPSIKANTTTDREDEMENSLLQKVNIDSKADEAKSHPLSSLQEYWNIQNGSDTNDVSIFFALLVSLIYPYVSDYFTKGQIALLLSFIISIGCVVLDDRCYTLNRKTIRHIVSCFMRFLVVFLTVLQYVAE